MTKETRELIVRALGNMQANDRDGLYKAQGAFRGLSAEEMREQYGQSSQTRQQIIDGYQSDMDKVTAAIREVERL